ncbi:uncharacterized protein K460DRAFT_99857 [Cucurbitaria berberidis CBS 394.84]|uniref:C2H2-type domain-containing protein n=1 Tax=Cucurbitaria berberidis CBS 394.84 TaxID=1168544 RepID=A0A9P4GGK6_9PLEO|nr:uncharacterized protein K460DRAFT_99857 [Cucurbitaria berberidis CBS 394.84]KAF1844871.1 hypothetical protein K460DRAFT_99857 [Cucurbitaria berberidis CBS 394.84]
MSTLTMAVPVDAEVVIATVVLDIARDFLSLADALTTEPRFAAQVASVAVHDEFSRFKLWAGNIAAHQKGRRSLEYRLRDAAHLKTETHNLLDALSSALHNALAIVKGERVPWDDFSGSDSELSDDDESSNDLQGSTELKQLLASTRTVITSLFRLSMAIRDPAPNSQSKSTITIDKSFYQQHDIQHVKEKFKACPDYLAERLGRAISGRRQYLSYREEHHQKLAKNIEKIGYERPITEFTTNSTEATRLKRSNSLNVFDEGDDAASQTSYATSVNATIRVPPLPKEARNKEFFECPFCFLLVSIHTATGWKQHMYRDLHPYCCTYEHCTTADRLYDSRRSWFAHELKAHRTSFECVEGCEKTFQVDSEFESHVQKNHPDLASLDMLSALKRTSARNASLMESTICDLCGRTLTLRTLQRHLGSHQQQLALFALPPNLDDTEEDLKDDEKDALNLDDEDDDEDISDISDEQDLGDVGDVGDSDYYEATNASAGNYEETVLQANPYAEVHSRLNQSPHDFDPVGYWKAEDMTSDVHDLSESPLPRSAHDFASKAVGDQSDKSSSSSDVKSTQKREHVSRERITNEKGKDISKETAGLSLVQEVRTYYPPLCLRCSYSITKL